MLTPTARERAANSVDHAACNHESASSIGRVDGDDDRCRLRRNQLERVRRRQDEVEPGQTVDELIERIAVGDRDVTTGDLSEARRDADGRSTNQWVEQIIMDLERERLLAEIGDVKRRWADDRCYQRTGERHRRAGI